MAKSQIPKKAAPQKVVKEVIKEIMTVKTALIVIIAVTFIAFLPTFGNSYVFWDDPYYILHNPLMGAPLKVIFGIPSGYYMWNYHPLTILVYSIENKFFGVDMSGYHAISLLLHLCNCVLVFFFVYNLLDKKNVLIAFSTAMLFGIHPMHVESVAWGAELKDVLYTFFFLAALICYVNYVKKDRQMKYLAYTLGLFLLSIISKGQAVTLPLSLLLIDYFLKRKLDSKMIVEKIPFFALSLLFGWIAIKAQDNSIIIHDSVQDLHNFFIGFYGLLLYLIRFIYPVHLSGLYPYPNPANTGNALPQIIKVAPLIIAILAGIIYKLFHRDRYVIFGCLFFFFNIVTVLKFIPVSEAIMADRYSYIPYIGLFFAVAYGFNKLLKNPAYKSKINIIKYAGIGVLLVLSSLTYARVMVWKDSISFWGDALKYDESYWHYYEGLGEGYLDKKDTANAMKYFQLSIDKDNAHLNPTNSSRRNLALCYYWEKKYNDAFNLYNAMISMNPNDADAYFSRGALYVDFFGKYDLGIADFNKVIELNPGNMDAVINKGLGYYKEGNFDEALNNYNQCTGKVNDGGRLYYLEALAYAGKGNYAKALENADQSQKMGMKLDSGLLQLWKSKNGSN